MSWSASTSDALLFGPEKSESGSCPGRHVTVVVIIGVSASIPGSRAGRPPHLCHHILARSSGIPGGVRGPQGRAAMSQFAEELKRESDQELRLLARADSL